LLLIGFAAALHRSEPSLCRSRTSAAVCGCASPGGKPTRRAASALAAAPDAALHPDAVRRILNYRIGQAGLSVEASTG
jgi:hypothetical protein